MNEGEIILQVRGLNENLFCNFLPHYTTSSFLSFFYSLIFCRMYCNLINQKPKMCHTFVVKNWSQLQLGIHEISNYWKKKNLTMWALRYSRWKLITTTRLFFKIKITKQMWNSVLTHDLYFCINLHQSHDIKYNKV